MALSDAVNRRVMDLKVMDESSFEEISWHPIDSGAFSQVWMAKHLQRGHYVVVKNINGSPSHDDVMREAGFMVYAAECEYIMRIMGLFKGIIPIKGLQSEGLVMEVMETSLASLLNTLKHLPPWPLVFRLAHQVALGMNYLHCLEPALIHKDLKPGNILLDSGLNVKITDFGTSMSNNETVPRNKDKETFDYAPPEKEGVTKAYDVYSYAMLLYNILNNGQSIPKFDKSKEERPSLKYVQGMEETGLKPLLNLMVKCWNQTPDQRPPFKDCVAVTERSYEVHKEGIHAAVYEVQQELHGDGGTVVEKELRTKMAEMSVELQLQKDKMAEMLVEHQLQKDKMAEMLVERQLQKDKIAALERDDAGPPAGSRHRRDYLKYVCELTLDPNTANSDLSLSENNRKVRRVREDQDHPPHPHRFKYFPQVLCREELTGRCYCEVQCSGDVFVALTQRDITTQCDDSLFGYNNKSWCLNCDGDDKRYSVLHNKESTVLPVRPSSSSSNRVAVYLDHAAGTVSFYTVSSDTLTHLHTFQSTFTGPLYVGFRCRGYDSSVSL